MPVDTQYQRALKLARAGELEKAQAVLQKANSPEAKTLLDRVNKAIAKRDAAITPKQEPSAPSSNRAVIVLGLFLAILIVGATALYFLYYLPSQAQGEQLHRKFAIIDVCRDVYFDEYMLNRNVSADGFVDACYKEADFAMIGMETEIDYCLAQTQDGALHEQFKRCLADNGFKFSGIWMSQAQ